MSTTGKQMRISKLLELSIQESGISEASSWIRKFVSLKPERAVLLQKEVTPENIADIIYGISFIAVKNRFFEDQVQKVYEFFKVLRGVATNNSLNMPKEVDYIASIREALSF